MTRSNGFEKFPTLARDWLGPTARARQVNLTYPVAGQEPRRAVGLTANRHLNYLAESIGVNVGGYPATEPSSSGGETWVASEAS